MISRIITILIFLTINSAFRTAKLNRIEMLSKSTECEANRVYQKDDVTCFCNEYGRWPHKNCSVVFTLHLQTVCKPGSYVQVDCNICRCNRAGSVDNDFCTKHVCSADPQDKITHRRTFPKTTKAKCDVNHWYSISACRLCFCLTKDNLLCAAETKTKEILLGKFDVTDCGQDWLTDVNKLLASLNPLRLGKKSEKNINQINIETVESKVIGQLKPTSEYEKREPLKNNPESILLNQDNGSSENIKVARNNVDVDSSDDSDSKINVEERKPIARIAGTTAMPFENVEDNDSNNSDELESDRKESNNESIDSKDDESVRIKKESEDVDVTKEAEPVTDNKNEVEKVDSAIDQESDQSLLKLNLPGMLGRVFNFGLRKSLVSLDSANCVPGSTLAIKCNTCFCLNNGKMLCTKKICGNN